ncbi:MAG: DsrE family protein, partial [Gammaproteobacteria bacterium]|nr:DsrE family protein [Gammaproteobacteria bacterium]
NLMAYAKVPPSHVHIVALFDGEVGYAAATNEFYRNAFNADNPNRTIVHALKKAGVQLLVCGQALAENHLPDSAIDPDVTITLSALMDAVVYGQKGYIYMRL